MTTIDEAAADFYDDLHATALTWYRDHPKDDHPPLMVSLLSDGSYKPILLNNLMGEEDDGLFGQRAATLQQAVMKIRMGEVYVRCTALINEAWKRKFSFEEANDPKRKRNKDYPDREEVLLFNLLTEHKQALMTCRIDRKTGTIEKAPFEWLDPTVYSGNMVR